MLCQEMWLPLPVSRDIGTGSGLVELALAHKEAHPTQHREEHGQNRRAESYRIVGFVWG